MLNIKFLYSLLFLFMATVLFSSCRKINNPIRESSREPMINIVVDINLRPEAKYYLVIENSESAPIYLSISKFFMFPMQRGEIKGNSFNLHFILIDELADNTVEIKSFFNVPFGRGIRITDENLKHAKASNSIVNLSFTNIPEFDIVNRTAKNQEQCFTQNTFETPVTSPELGGETYESSQLFYACFQSGNNATYKLVRTPANKSNYTIDFSDLKSNVLKYSFQKTLNGATIKHMDLQGWNNPYLEGKYLEMFNIDNFAIFPSSDFNIFIPKMEVELRYYIQNSIYSKDDNIYRNWFYSATLTNSINLLDAGLNPTSIIGQLPIIESTNDTYDEAQIIIEGEGFKWTMHSSKTDVFYIPEIPLEISDNFPASKNLNELFINQDYGTIKLIDYSTIENYEGVLDLHFGKTKLDVESNYRTQEQIFSIK